MNYKWSSKKSSFIELGAAFYMNVFVLLKPILNMFSYRSTLILLVVTILLIVSSMVFNGCRLNRERTYKCLALFSLVSIIFVFDYIFRANPYTWENYYYFLIYGLVSGLLLINVSRFDKLLFYWCFFAILAGVIVALDPINQYAITGNYMSFGMAILPAFTACVIVFNNYKKKAVFPLLIVFLVEIIIYANRGATLTAIGVMIFSIIFMTDDKRKRIRRCILLTIAVIIAVIFLNNIFYILDWLQNKIGIGSYSLTAFRQLFTGGDTTGSGRILIWNDAFGELRDNWVFGMGIGGYEAENGNYAHNFFLDVFITHGVFIGGIIFIFLFKQIIKILKYKDRDLLILSSMFGLNWIIQLMFSFTYWQTLSFWIFIILNLYYGHGKMVTNLGIAGEKDENINKYL